MGITCFMHHIATPNIGFDYFKVIIKIKPQEKSIGKIKMNNP